MAWSTQAMARTTASPEQVWRLWSDVGGWSLWDPEVESSALDGAFTKGVRGSLKPRGGPLTRFELVSVEPCRGFTNCSRLPLARIDFIHTLREDGGGTVIEHRVEMSGPLTFLFRRLIGAGLARGLPGAVTRLARLAEGGPG
ncbi:MAG: SRPBCC family protein [Phenylobacterium sp.]|jgi:hypothetical protein|uniref:SRPBCC family protein n=1 Tax=Phenylobacterium sp. TaxID=1871053 RepID=UPI002A26747D|nr:SRPBCC family protein [Phenylobacterium sp.]MCA3729818.1 SRPBCC family protein [Phenylobacterium sp.]MCA3746690.1 SRPBCC family protein [Phenylobacterium sp.]MCA3752042.1 SRPBCC family protein [Phenylobacterium sp.]MCA6333067.1 SRPBCC family protein [Phenylobacterium sp.]